MKIYPCGKLQRVREAFRGIYAGDWQKARKKTGGGQRARPSNRSEERKFFSEQQTCDTEGKFVFCASNNARRGPKAMTFGQRQGDCSGSKILAPGGILAGKNTA